MKKAKTNKKIITIFSAILGVVFAFITGFTYCAVDLTLGYGSRQTTTQAYMANQQYKIINDTLENPISFSSGSHNFEIALQYSFDYAFDFRLEYSLTWKNVTDTTVGTDNVILNFADRDNLIVDENYIYYAGSVAAGSGKLPIITGVQFVDVEDETYIGGQLEINIDSVKIYKTQPSYDRDHTLYEENSDAAEAWYQNKNKSDIAGAYIMVYNYRRDFKHGMKYPGAKTAYKRESKDASTWIGGNRAYAGTGIYVISGASAVSFDVQVNGIWRIESAPTVTAFENSIQYNYVSDYTQTDWEETNWEHTDNWDNSDLFETRKFSYTIPANSTYYINVLDSVEIISAGNIQSSATTDYRLVTNMIIINPNLESKKEFKYELETEDYIKTETISNNSSSSATTSYSKNSITIANSSIYNNGLYESTKGSEQTFRTNISLINNDATEKTVDIAYKLFYHISNGHNELIVDGTRATNFADASRYYTETVEKTTYLDLENSSLSTNVTLAPYSSVNIASYYAVTDKLAEYIKTTYGNDYDVWVFLVPTIKATTTSAKTSLAVESKIDVSTLTVSVKNNSNKTVSGVSVDLKIEMLGQANYILQTTETAPDYWEANWWKYYVVYNGKHVPATTLVLNSETNTMEPVTTSTYAPNTFYQKVQTYSPVTIPEANLVNGFELSDGKYVTSKSLQPGETLVVGTVSTLVGTDEPTPSTDVIVTGYAEASTRTTPNTLMLINNGKDSAFLMNASSTSYYVRFNGTLVSTTMENIKTASDNYNYYIGIIRPGQIVSVPMKAVATTIDTDTVEDFYTSSSIPSGWSAAESYFASYFNQK